MTIWCAILQLSITSRAHASKQYSVIKLASKVQLQTQADTLLRLAGKRHMATAVQT